jgi:SDR family mycofactocin-dependent oxidoreductase
MPETKVLVTGAARGIGAAVCRRLAADGAHVVALDRCSDHAALDYPLGTRKQLDSVVGECIEGGAAAAEAVEADVADRRALEAALAGRGPFDSVVCAAGVLWGGDDVWATPPAVWDALVGANVTGVLNTAAVTIPPMLEAAPRPGRFVAVASAAGSKGLRSMGAYSATKHAVVGLIRSMAADLADSGITANAVAPGSTDTDKLGASAEVYGLASPEEFSVHHTLGRLLRPEEVAEAIVWLCSAASSGVTGTVVPVDAGMTAT